MPKNNLPQIGVDYNAAKAELLRRDLKFFVREFWDEINNQPLEWNWHLDVLCEELMDISFRVARKEPKKADYIFNVPPGTSKTKIISVLATCWDFANQPSIKEFVGSYSDSAVLSMAYDIRTVLRSEKYKLYFPEVEVNKDFDTKHEFRTSKGGHFYAFTVAGTLTSKHADILKIDDPLNPSVIASTAEIEKTNKFFDRTLPTRKTNKAITPTILTMQRLDENDPSGHLLRKPRKKIIHICLPGELSEVVKPAHLKARYVNGLLDPNRLSTDILEEMQIDLGSDGYAAQIGQDPSPATGVIWKKEYFKVIADGMWPSKRQFKNYGFDWDTAVTDKETNAASAYVAAGNINNDIYIDDIGFAWNAFPEQIKWMKKLGSPHYIENKSGGPDLKSSLTSDGVNAMLVEVLGGDKVARAKMATIPAEAGRVFIKQSLIDKLLNDVRQGILKFPNNKHKDLADALAQAILRLNKKAIVVASDNNTDDMIAGLNFD